MLLKKLQLNLHITVVRNTKQRLVHWPTIRINFTMYRIALSSWLSAYTGQSVLQIGMSLGCSLWVSKSWVGITCQWHIGSVHCDAKTRKLFVTPEGTRRATFSLCAAFPFARKWAERPMQLWSSLVASVSDTLWQHKVLHSVERLSVPVDAVLAARTRLRAAEPALDGLHRPEGHETNVR